MTRSNYFWMEQSIEFANLCNPNYLKICAIAADNQNNLICYAYSNEKSMSWSKTLINKIKSRKKLNKLFLTINSLDFDNDFELNKLLETVHIDEIYIGVPDYNIVSYNSNDPILNNAKIKRYPDELQKKILLQNEKFYSNSKQSIKHNNFYYSTRISGITLQNLSKIGYNITKNELNKNKDIEKLSRLISKKYGCNYEDIKSKLKKIISNAFDEKYSNYNYVYDVREMNDNWIITFKNLFSDLYLSKKNNIAILNVGVADGTEAISLFKDFKNITFVDIAQNCLKKIKDYNPNSITILNRAEKLESLKDNQFDRYVSLRTYNSSFFNKIQAIQEAKRVLKPKGKIIISIANGFLDITQKRVIPGLIIPGTEYVDIYRGIETINKLKIILIKNDFININIIPTDSEIYLTADCEKGEK